LQIQVSEEERQEILAAVPEREFAEWARDLLLRAAQRLLKTARRKRES